MATLVLDEDFIEWDETSDVFPTQCQWAETVAQVIMWREPIVEAYEETIYE